MKGNIRSRRRCIISLLAFFLFRLSDACPQDTIFARRIIDTLTSVSFHGRGYTDEGMKRAADFLQSQFVAAGLTPMYGNGYRQKFSYPVNTFPGAMSVKLNGKHLRPGADYIIAAESRSKKGTFRLEKSDSSHFINTKSQVIVSIEKKLTWNVRPQQADYTMVKIGEAVSETPENIELNVESKLIKKFKAENICGIVLGAVNPDSFILFTAHYDHLGGMGNETFFPGANDNASGVSQLLGLARWYAKNPQKYSIGFILFAGEEAGLRGSEYFVNHPLINLKKIRFLINLDLTGTGVEGITVVNATEFNAEFELLKMINSEKQLFSTVNSRGKAKNSDHYWFTEKGVPAFFIYTLGGIEAYHDVYDIAATLPNDHYIQLFQLLREFVNQIQ